MCSEKLPTVAAAIAATESTALMPSGTNSAPPASRVHGWTSATAALAAVATRSRVHRQTNAPTSAGATMSGSLDIQIEARRLVPPIQGRPSRAEYAGPRHAPIVEPSGSTGPNPRRML